MSKNKPGKKTGNLKYGKLKNLGKKEKWFYRDDGKQGRKTVFRGKERGGGSWKRYLRDYESYLEEEEEDRELR